MEEFERAWTAKDKSAMARVLAAAKFTPEEIESILWPKRDRGPAGQWKAKWDAVVGWIGIAAIAGVAMGGVFVYASSGLARANGTMERKVAVLMRDQRSPSEAYYQPFGWGFALGAAGALLMGALGCDSFKGKRE